MNVTGIYSTLGNPDSLVPLLVKDLSSTTGMTAGSLVTGKEEGQDRLIDELGTEVIWLCAIPAFKWLFDKTIFKAYNLDSKFDVRNLKNKDVFEKIKKLAPDEEVKKNLEKISKKQGLFKNLALYKFFFSTGMAILSYIGLTMGKQKYTENKIRKNLVAEYNAKKEKEAANQNENNNNSSTPSFKGLGNVVKYFAFSPVRNMYILDGSITLERLASSRSPQELIGYSIKEASTLFFMYYAGVKIQQLLEKNATKKHHRNIGLDARVLESNLLKKTFEDGSIKKSLDEFKPATNLKDADLYEYLHKNPDNLVVKASKKSNIIKLYKKTDKIDTREYIDLDKVKEVYKNLEALYGQYLDALKNGTTSDKFFKQVKKLKRGSIITNIATCIFALGVVTPGIMLLKRFLGKDDKEFQTKKEIREQLIKEGVIA